MLTIEIGKSTDLINKSMQKRFNFNYNYFNSMLIFKSIQLMDVILPIVLNS